jgi:acetylglutamate kinase
MLAQQWASAPRSFCIVHGGGETISELQRQLGRSPRFVDGRRVTTEADIEVLRMALSGVANKHLVNSLSTKGIRAVGISGEDGSLVVARQRDAERLGRVGQPTEVNDGLLRVLLGAGFLPVISPVSREGGAARCGALNVNADDAAAAIAISMDADELLLISDVAGVMIGGIAVASMSSGDAVDAIESGAATDGMKTKLCAALDALALGVPQVRIGGLDALADPSSGTTLLATPQLA